MKYKECPDHIEVWATGRQVNNILYTSTTPLEECSRKFIASIHRFLLTEISSQKAKKETERIKKHLGKLIMFRDIEEINFMKSIPTTRFIHRLPSLLEDYVDNLGLDLNPDFQRGHVWTLDQQIRFLEFIMRGGKCPPILFNNTEWNRSFKGDFVIVDGKQRLTAILDFLDNKFPIFSEKDPDSVGYYNRDFDYAGAEITTFVNDLRTRKQVLNWYLNLNGGYIQHSKEELERVKELRDSLNKPL